MLEILIYPFVISGIIKTKNNHGKQTKDAVSESKTLTRIQEVT